MKMVVAKEKAAKEKAAKEKAAKGRAGGEYTEYAPHCEINQSALN
jgi:hypothetical protein